MPELRRSGRYVGASLDCEALRRVLSGAMAPLPDAAAAVRCRLTSAKTRERSCAGGRPRRARYWSHTNSFRIASSLHSDVIFGRDRAHSMSFCRFFYTSWPDVVAAAPYCQTTLVIRMSTGSSPSALAPARGSRFVY